MEKKSRWEALLGVIFLLMLIHNVSVVQIITQYSLFEIRKQLKMCVNLNRNSSFPITVSIWI